MPDKQPEVQCACRLLAKQIAEELADKLKPPERVEERLISPDEACKRLNCSRSTLDRQRGKLPFVKLRASGRGYDVNEAALSQWISRGTALAACWVGMF